MKTIFGKWAAAGILLIPAGILISFSAAYVPSLVEKVYSREFYRLVSQGISSVTGIVPVSLAEIAVACVSAAIIVVLSLSVKKVISLKEKKWRPLVRLLINAAAAAGFVYFAFLIVWGLNYHRSSYAEIAGLEIKPSSVKELEVLCRSLVTRTNSVRDMVREDSRGVMKTPAGYDEVFGRAYLGYKAAALQIPALGGNYGRPKNVLLSGLMSYTGITGVYFPFTGEANVNTSVPDSTLPSTACHEMAHQRGFAREDEANYIAYLTCSLNPDPDFQYSGFLLALINAANALYTYDRTSYREVRKGYGAGLIRDLNDISEFWAKYEGPVERLSSNINDAYLKANLQKDGVYSYGRMVDLLIAEYRKKGLLPS